MSSGPRLQPGDILRGLKGLPSAPAVLPRLKRLLGDANCRLEDITALIRIDAGLAARVLQVSNGVGYSQGVPCCTVEEAVQRVGYEAVYSIVSYAAASQVLVRPLEPYGLEPGELWEMSIATALAAEILAGETGQDRCAAYTVGLLHSIGRVAISDWTFRHDPTLCLPSRGFPDETSGRELAAFGFLHSDVGAALLRQWGFGENIAEPVGAQFAPQRARQHRAMAALLHAARWLGHVVRGATPPLPCAADLKPLALPAGGLEEQVAAVSERFAAVSDRLRSTVTSGAEPSRFAWRGN